MQDFLKICKWTVRHPDEEEIDLVDFMNSNDFEVPSDEVIEKLLVVL